MNQLAENIEYIMAANGLRPADVIDKGVSGATLYRALGRTKQQYGFQQATLEKLAKALGCQVRDLTGDSLPTHIRKLPPAPEQYEASIRSHLGGLTPEVLKAATDVQHGRLEAIDCTRPQPPQEDKPQEKAAALSHRALLSLLLNLLDGDTPGHQVFELYGRQVAALLLSEIQKQSKEASQ